MSDAAADRIEETLEQDRAHLRETLGAIEQKMSPGRLLDEAMSYFDTGPKAFASDLTRQVRDNPMPALLTGVGLAWLIMSDRKAAQTGTAASGSVAHTPAPDPWTSATLEPEDYEAWAAHDRLQEAEWACVRLTDETDDAYAARLEQSRAAALGLTYDDSEPRESFGSRVSAAAASVKHKGASARDRFKQMAGSAKHGIQKGGKGVGSAVRAGRDGATAAAGSAKQLHETNPIATAAIAVALGAVVGAALPLSRKEEEVLGGAADKGLALGAEVSRKAADGLSQKVRDGGASAGAPSPTVM